MDFAWTGLGLLRWRRAGWLRLRRTPNSAYDLDSQRLCQARISTEGGSGDDGACRFTLLSGGGSCRLRGRTFEPAEGGSEGGDLPECDRSAHCAAIQALWISSGRGRSRPCDGEEGLDTYVVLDCRLFQGMNFVIEQDKLACLCHRRNTDVGGYRPEAETYEPGHPMLSNFLRCFIYQFPENYLTDRFRS